MTTTTATVIRTAMVGGGTSYDVYWPTKAKPSRPLHGGHYYATIVCTNGGEYYRTDDAIMPRRIWGMDFGLEKYDAHRENERKAKRLAVRVAKRAFPELAGHRELPALWAPWNLPSETKRVRVRLSLPV